MEINFFLSKKGLYREVYLNLIFDSNSVSTFRTRLYIPEKDWCKEYQRPKNIYLKKYKKLNTILNLLRIELIDYVQKQEKNISKHGISKKITVICSLQKISPAKNSFLYYTELYITSRKEFISYPTYKRYKVFYNLLERFEGFLTKHIYVEEINSDFIYSFILFGKKEKYGESTIYRTIQFVKTILNYVESIGIQTSVRKLRIYRRQHKRELLTLTTQEISQIKHTTVPKNLQAAKDWLIISCYTGQRFSDFINFNSEKILNIHITKCLSFTQQKTKKEILLPLHPLVIEIIERNNNNFPEPMSIQNYNNGIKQVARIANLKTQIKINKRIGHRKVATKVEKWEALSSHIGRRSFATNFYGKIPTPLLMDATGHSSELMFLKYIKPIDVNRVISLGSYFEKTHNESSKFSPKTN